MPATLRPIKPKADDPEILARFTESIRLGLPISISATNAGIGEQTARDWLHQGDAEMDENSSNEQWVPSPQAGFAWGFKQALASFATENMGVMQADKVDAPPGKRWVNAQTQLERRFPRDYGRQQYVDIKEERTLTLKLELPAGAVAALSRTLNNTKLLAAPSEDSQEPE